MSESRISGCHQQYAPDTPGHLALVSIQTHTCVPCMKVCLIDSVPCAQVLVLLLGASSNCLGGEDGRRWSKKMTRNRRVSRESQKRQKKYRFHLNPRVILRLSFSIQSQKMWGEQKNHSPPVAKSESGKLVDPSAKVNVLHVLLKFSHGWIFR